MFLSLHTRIKSKRIERNDGMKEASVSKRDDTTFTTALHVKANAMIYLTRTPYFIICSRFCYGLYCLVQYPETREIYVFMVYVCVCVCVLACSYCSKNVVLYTVVVYAPEWEARALWILFHRWACMTRLGARDKKRFVCMCLLPLYFLSPCVYIFGSHVSFHIESHAS